MDQASYAIWGTEYMVQPAAKMKLVNIPTGQGSSQFMETIPRSASTYLELPAATDSIMLQTHDGKRYFVDDRAIRDIDQLPPENLIYIDDASMIQGEVVNLTDSECSSSDVRGDAALQQNSMQTEPLSQEEFTECQVTEEVITDDWVQSQGEECVQVTVDQLGATAVVSGEDDISVPLPTDQDEYTLSRPHPCDFCSRRFKKKAALNNHIVSHSHDRPNICKLCGERYVRRNELLHHLKQHATEERFRIEDEYDDMLLFSTVPPHNIKRLSVSIDEEDAYIADTMSYNSQPPTQLISTVKSPRKSQNYSNNNHTATTVHHAKSLSLSENAFPRNSKPSQPRAVKTEAGYSSGGKVGPPSVTESTIVRFPVTDEKRPFVCKYCGKSFTREKALASHSRVHGGDVRFECNRCGDQFWDHGLLQEHIQNRHNVSNATVGGNATVPSESSGSAYADDANPVDDSQFYCNICLMTFSRQDQLKKHIKQEHGQKTANQRKVARIKQEYQGDIIVEEENDEDSNGGIIIHRLEEEFGDGETAQPLNCNACGATFDEPLDMLAHAEVHAREEPFKCQLCGDTFLNEKLIKSHLNQLHKLEMTDKSCAICGKACKNHSALMKHSWEHSRERTHCCSKCGKTFHNKARLKRHMMSHRNKTVKCEVCMKEFPDGRSLMNHRHSHTKSGMFPCHECGKTFGSRSSQQIHIRIHTGEKPYGCRYCWKAFADGGTLRKHERIHTGEKPYGCAVCPRAFNQRVVLREHIRSHHSTADITRGTVTHPFYCSVCSTLFEKSDELVKHLIQHSDYNTAQKRQPPTFPRKYKRRRKLKPQEVERLQKGEKRRKAQYEELSMSDDTSEKHDSTIEPEAADNQLKTAADILLDYEDTTDTGKKSVGSPRFTYDLHNNESNHTKPPHIHDNGINLLTKLELVSSGNDGNDLSSFSPTIAEPTRGRPSRQATIKVEPESPKRRVTKQPSGSNNSSTSATKRGTESEKRARMIHTTKSRVSTMDGGKRKTKTVITKGVATESLQQSTTNAYSELELKRSKSCTVPTYREIPSDKISSESFPLLDDGKDDTEEIMRSGDLDDIVYGETDAMSRNQSGDNSYDEIYNQRLLMEISRKDKYIDKFNSDIVNDLKEILRSPMKPPNNSNSSIPPAIPMVSSVTHDGLYLSDTTLNQQQPATSASSLSAIVEKFEYATQHKPQVGGTRKSRKQNLRSRPDLSPIRSTPSADHRSDHDLLRSRRLTRRQLVHEVNFLLGTFEQPAPSLMTVKQEAPDPSEKLADMLLNDQTMVASPVAKVEHRTDDEHDSDRSSDYVNSEQAESFGPPEVLPPDSSALLYTKTATLKKEPLFQCEICYEEFGTRTQLLQHISIHI